MGEVKVEMERGDIEQKRGRPMSVSSRYKIAAQILVIFAVVFILLYIVDEIFIFFALMLAAIAGGLLNRRGNRLVKNINEFSSKLKHCYSCGVELGESRPETCPSCHVPLNLLEVIDV